MAIQIKSAKDLVNALANQTLKPSKTEEALEKAGIKTRFAGGGSSSTSSSISNIELENRKIAEQQRIAEQLRVEQQRQAEIERARQSQLEQQRLSQIAQAQRARELLFFKAREQREKLPRFEDIQRVVRPAPTTREQIKEIIATRNPVTGLLEYGAEKLQGGFFKLERKYTPRSQSLAETGAISTAVQTVPFFTPPTAPAFLVASSIGTFSTGGRLEAKRIAEEIKQRYGVPATITKTAIYGLSATGVAAGGRALVGQAENALRLTKLESGFLAKSVDKDIINDIERFKTDSIIRTEKTGLFPRTFFIRSKSDISVLRNKGLPIKKGEIVIVPEDESRFIFVGKSRGAIVEPRLRLDLVTGKLSIEKSKTAIELGTGQIKRKFITPFKSAAAGEGLMKDVDIAYDLGKGAKVKKTVKGFDFIGKSETSLLDSSKQSLFFGRGAELTEDSIFSLARNIPIKERTFRADKLSRPRESIFGLTKNVKEKTESFITKTKTSKQLQINKLSTDSLIQQLEKQQVQSAIKAKLSLEQKSFEMTSSLLGTRLLAPKQQTQKLPITKVQSQSLISQSQLDKPLMRLSFETATRERQKQNIGSSTMQSERQAQRQLQKPLQLQETKQQQRLLQRQLQPQQQILRQRQLTRQIQKMNAMIRQPLIPKRIGIFKFGFKTNKSQRQSFSKPMFAVQLRRRGLFKTIGAAESLAKASLLGQKKALSSLGQTFRILAPKNVKTKGLSLRTSLFTRPKSRALRSGLTFTQRRGKTLVTRSEIIGLQSARRIRQMLNRPITNLNQPLIRRRRR